MSANILAFIITHGDLACSLASVSEKLVAPQTHLHCYSTQVLTSDEIVRKIDDEIKTINPDKIIVFVDLIGSNCWIIGNKIKHVHAETAVVSGVNVPMLISYLINYQRLEWKTLLEKIISDAQKGILMR